MDRKYINLLLYLLIGTVILYFFMDTFYEGPTVTPEPEAAAVEMEEPVPEPEPPKEISPEIKVARQQLKDLDFESGSVGDKLFNFLLSGKLNFSREVYELKNKNFEASNTVGPAMEKELKQLAEVLLAYPDVRIQLAVYTDSEGTFSEQDQVCEQQAGALSETLLKHGVAQERVETIAYGSRYPIADNRTEKGRALNRRVEMTILDI